MQCLHQVLEIYSYSRAYHAYADVQVQIIEKSGLVKLEPKAVAILNGTRVVGQVPLNLVPILFQEILSTKHLQWLNETDKRRSRLWHSLT